MTITPIQLSEILGKTRLGVDFINKKTASLNEVFEKYSINTPLRVCHYLAQILHETGSFVYKEEIWGNTKAQLGYDTRTDLGNSPKKDGDGKLYKGRGDIQITGKGNYKKLTVDFNIDLIKNPQSLATEPYCSMCGGWFWNQRKLNFIADKPDNWRGTINERFQDLPKFEYITVRINGGFNGLDDRKHWFEKCKSVLIK